MLGSLLKLSKGDLNLFGLSLLELTLCFFACHMELSDRTPHGLGDLLRVVSTFCCV